MSKTLGNVIDPLDTIKDYGTDALRFTLSLGTAGQVCFFIQYLLFCYLLCN
jgi:valyl-tRNA synthetase